MLSGCAKKEEQATTTLNIGYQKYGILPILKARGDLEKALKEQGVQVKWVEFPAGPQLLEGLNVGSVSLGEAGEAPPIFAQAANPNLVYVANQPAAPKAEALLVQKDSPIQSIKDLKGKRVALNKGSNVHYLLLKVLEANNLSLSDIQPVYLPPSDARAALEVTARCKTDHRRIRRSKAVARALCDLQGGRPSRWSGRTAPILPPVGK